jgi:hypothetical protein
MKKQLSIFSFILVFMISSGMALASGAPRRDSTPVDNAFAAYTSNGWIVSPDEEPVGDSRVSGEPEYDITGVISCYDSDYVRVDILLNQEISFHSAAFYGIRLEYDDMNEYYTYETDTKKLIYRKEQNGKIVEAKDLTKEDAPLDTAGVTDSGDIKNGDVYFIINKKEHISGEKGKRYYLPCYFYSGYYNTKDEPQIADDTLDVDLEFEY